jgi:cell wall-associated NlpC family hydrolase
MSRTVTAHGSALRTLRLPLLAGLLVAILTTLVAGSTSTAQAATRHHRHHHTHHHAHPGRVAHAMGIAVRQHGKPYAYGAAGPRAFDCSGLTSYAFHHAGFRRMPRTASAQAHFGRHIPRSRMHRGDLIFFTGGGGVYHVGLFAGFKHGHRLVLHAPYPGQRVRTQPLWTNAWFPETLRRR